MLPESGQPTNACCGRWDAWSTTLFRPVRVCHTITVPSLLLDLPLTDAVCSGLPEWLRMDLADTQHDSQGSYFYKCLDILALAILSFTEGNL